MKSILKYSIIVCLCLSASYASAQVQTENKNEIRVFYGDESWLKLADIFGNVFPTVAFNVAGGNYDHNYSGMLGAGYRHQTGRFRLGADVGFLTETTTCSWSDKPSLTMSEKDYWAIILPTGEYTYLKKGIFELYGSVSAGAMLDLSQMKSNTIFAFQANPIAMRLQGKKLGYFIEGGVGFKGIITTGLYYRF